MATVNYRNMKIGQILMAHKAVTQEQLRDALAEQQKTPEKRIGQIFVEKGILTPIHIAKALALQHGLQFVNLSNYAIPPEMLDVFPKEVIRQYTILPLKKTDKKIWIAIDEPSDIITISDNIGFLLGRDVECVMSATPDLEAAIKKTLGEEETSLPTDDYEAALQGYDGGELDIDYTAEHADKEGVSADEAPVINLVTKLIVEAVKMRTSDIHIEPMEKKLRIRYRIDGICKEMPSPPKQLQGSLLSRVKLMAGMNIAEKRVPQDGRIAIKILGKELDLRVSALPAQHGESIVMRILDKQLGLVSLEDLGFHPDDYRKFRQIIKKPNGIFLVTGPTGSGKTTTLYAALKELNKPNVKIITAENPVEYVISGLNQSQVKTQIGMTFAKIIRAMLRQSPNIILVGEIRDPETAEIAVQAALTGHLVFSTIHTNDAPSTIARLLDIGVKPFLAASSIQAIMSQRLVRVLCPACRKPYMPSASELATVNLTLKDTEGKTLYKPGGCEQCNNHGFKGRKGLFELMEMSTTLREMAFRKEPTNVIREQARKEGMVTLLEDGRRKILEGITTVQEVLSLAKREDLTYSK